MRNRIWMLLSVVVLSALVLTACPPAAAPAQPAAAPAEVAAAPTEAPAAEAAAPTEAPAAEAAPAAAEDAGPKLVIWADNTRAPILSGLSEGFSTEYGVIVEVVEKGFGDIRDGFKTSAPSGEGPDIIIGAHDWLGELASNGLLAEMDLGDKTASFNPLALELFTYEGKLVGLPYATENLALFYNTDLVSEVPADWAGVQTLAKELQDSGKAKQGFAFNTGSPYDFYPIQTAFGGYVFSKADAGGYDPTKLGIDDEGSLAAAAWLDGMVKDKLLTGDVDWDVMHKGFENGETAMLITGPWALTRIKDSGVPFKIAGIPGGGKPFLGGQGFMVSAFSKDPLLAQTFLSEFVATDEVMLALFKADPRPSAWTPIAEAAATEVPELADFTAAGANADPMPNIPAMSSVWGAWGDAMKLITAQSEAPDAAFKNAAEQIRKAISEAK